ncbi:ADP-ribosylglycohydrolase family protein [Deinococcus soli (ex Cha et al. 2016)]|uniref:ADP-ribosylglycohydrolase n=2 Tax=Deinococcus soli (ex Cha et al. 2016) TaxID=1309411 RepID=A0ACC6KBG0_9DEIO|nr:ADP-ribosylglycohydrolase family protein [Deinococcus soli (ex Cha et al. 2016)]MDR6216720.1 ADP-ribosylglycohydrolase [Deinococcus soli (ex Cha et al. 2016)]MDR6327541.1 ADP-ribosylglycohydrolase [Deinococcus soli (ex Cha et al. 2016)]MDR6749816.1 ADP-ribosylglycohydrolase [Deinococcus soli (ex Cha et al. 2016)]
MPEPLDVLLSLCAADALGAATEFKSPDVIQARYGASFRAYQPGSVFGFAPGEATDDSQMVVATLLGAARGEGHAGVLAAFREWLAAAPPDVGGLTRQALRLTFTEPQRLDGGALAWERGGFDGAGNGGLMRVAAAWLLGHRGAALAREAAVLTALTHADPRCVYASVFLTAFMEALADGQAYVAAVQAALGVMDSLDARDVLVEAGVLGLHTQDAHRAFRGREREARAQVRARVRSGLEGTVTSQSGYVLDTLEAAVAHARRADWWACVEPAVLGGDDSDTVACVVGAVVGARGLSTPPELLPELRLGHSWPGWDRGWIATQHLPNVLARAARSVAGTASSP